MAIIAEYIWVDGTEPTALVRSKTKILPGDPMEEVSLETFPTWAFDGSSTAQAEGADSDCILEPVRVLEDPVRGVGAYLVLCEVYNPDGSPHASNKRSVLRAIVDKCPADADPWVAFEQEYTFFKGSRPLGFPAERRYPAPQGPYYCGVGADEVYGREVVEDHLAACLDAGIQLTGINAEVMPGQWEYQCGGPGVSPLEASDHLWLSRWLLYRVGEDHDISATLDPKPVPGDWNGAGMHTNFSTHAMRSEGGRAVIEATCDKLGEKHFQHLEVYGHGNEARLTGAHETCSYKEFRWGVANRTCSIRIPRMVATEGKGYLEDRRPAANADPYDVCAALLKTTFDLWS
ncbi:MAG: glutamine synthetase beta-grasp domain-containing protein [Alphaproteobacteria bacterium]|nr:glutamine synthetase beta-grasp domain-containing protein [Alphaproteobacteria bacterium]MCB9797962.1 glutamine synthetase beta-grasp domain-containing protein [Alphaproteobacteria bacterium]